MTHAQALYNLRWRLEVAQRSLADLAAAVDTAVRTAAPAAPEEMPEAAPLPRGPELFRAPGWQRWRHPGLPQPGEAGFSAREADSRVS